MKPGKCRQKLACLIFVAQIILPKDALADEVDEFTSLLYEGYAETFVQGTDEIVRYQIVDGLAIMEGDILLGEHEYVQAYGIPGFKVVSTQGAATGDEDFRGTWPNGEVPYSFHSDLPLGYISAIEEAMEWIESAANVRFIERTEQSDYVQFYNGSGCNSMVGYSGGIQQISLGSKGCATPGVIAHELLHTLGFWHEQSRADRHQHITINWSNVQSGTEYNFQKAGATDDRALDDAPYDFESIMHYRYDAFSANGQPTINPKDPQVDRSQIGQRSHLSKLDKANLVKLYGSKHRGDEIKLTADSGARTGLSVKSGQWIFFEIQIPRDRTLLSAQLSGEGGDADLYIRLEKKPDVSNYECRSYRYGNTEECTVNLPLSGTWYIGVYGDNSSDGLRLDWQLK